MPKRIQVNRGQVKPLGPCVANRGSRFGNSVCRPTNRTWQAHQQRVLDSAVTALAASPARMPINLSRSGQGRDLDVEKWRYLFRQELPDLDLACTCSIGWPCYADVLLLIANNLPARASSCRVYGDPSPSGASGEPSSGSLSLICQTFLPSVSQENRA